MQILDPGRKKGEVHMAEGHLQELDSQTFETEVIAASGPVVVDFWAPWCGPCKAVGPVLERLAEDHTGKVKVKKVNVDANQELAARYGVMSIPTVVLFDGGQVKKQLVGAHGQKDYEQAFGLV